MSPSDEPNDSGIGSNISDEEGNKAETGEAPFINDEFERQY